MALLAFGGFYLRVYRIDLIPWGLNNDEAINAIETREILDDPHHSFATLTTSGLNRETMFHHLAAFSFRSAEDPSPYLSSAPYFKLWITTSARSGRRAGVMGGDGSRGSTGSAQVILLGRVFYRRYGLPAQV